MHADQGRAHAHSRRILTWCDPAEALAAFERAGVTFWTGVPDSLLASFCRRRRGGELGALSRHRGERGGRDRRRYGPSPRDRRGMRRVPPELRSRQHDQPSRLAGRSGRVRDSDGALDRLERRARHQGRAAARTSGRDDAVDARGARCSGARCVHRRPSLWRRCRLGSVDRTRALRGPSRSSYPREPSTHTRRGAEAGMAQLSRCAKTRSPR